MLVKGKVVTPSGGVLFNGAATTSLGAGSHEWMPQGGLAFGGAAATQANAIPSGVGDLVVPYTRQEWERKRRKLIKALAEKQLAEVEIPIGEEESPIEPQEESAGSSVEAWTGRELARVSAAEAEELRRILEAENIAWQSFYVKMLEQVRAQLLQEMEEEVMVLMEMM